MADVQHSYGVRFEGLGRDPEKTEGLCFYWGNPITAAQRAASNFEWVGGPGSAEGLIELPDGSDSTVDLWTASLSLSAVAPRLHLSETAALALMARALTPIAYLDQTITFSQTTITFSAELADDAYEGTVIYVGDEAIRLNTHTGDAQFLVTRGMWGTHRQNLPRYIRVFDGPSYRKGREITLVRFDHSDDSEETRWFGALNDAPPTNEEHTTLECSATEVLSFIARGRVNLGAPDLSDPEDGRFVGHGVNAGRLSANIDLDPKDVRVRGKEALANTSHRATFQVGDSLVFGRWNTTHQRYGLVGTHTGKPKWGSPPIEEAEPVYEVVVVARELDVVDGETRPQTDDQTSNVAVSSTTSLEHPFNPIAVWLAMTIDHPDYNVLGEAWNLGAPAEWFDLDDIEETIHRTRHIKIDRLILGWDGKPVTPWEQFKSWCQAYGLFPCIRVDGRISVRVAHEAGPAEVFGSPTVTAQAYRLHWKPSEADGVDILSGTYGELPWADGVPYTVQLLDFTDPDDPVPQFSRRNGVLADRSRAEINMPTRSDPGTLIQSLTGMAAARHIGAPKLGIRVDDVGFGHGDYVRLAKLNAEGDYVRDQHGRVIPVDESARWVGLVVSKRSLYAEDSAEIDIHLANYDGTFPRWRSPSADIASVAGDTVTLEQGRYVVGGDDGAAFTVGDQVQIWDGDTFARRSSEVLVIGTINAHQIVFTTTPSTPPVAGDIIELAFLSTAAGYPEDGNPALFDGGLAYAYMADDARTIGPNDDDAHIYGQGSL